MSAIQVQKEVTLSEKPTPYYATPKQPRLVWNNRDKRKVAEPLPVQTVEVIRPFFADKSQTSLEMASDALPENRLIWTNDNLVALTSLLHGDGSHEPLEGKIDLIYIDPPFAVQSDFKISIEIEDGIDDEKLPTLIEELAYKDTWRDGLDSYLSMMRDRLELLKQLLSPTGSIYVHCDWHAGHYLKVLLDEVFGYDNFKNEIVWQRTGAHNDAGKFGNVHDVIYFYSRGPEWKFGSIYVSHSDEHLQTRFNLIDPKNGKHFFAGPITAPGDGPPRLFRDKLMSPPAGRHWSYSQAKINELDAADLIYFSSTGVPYLKQYKDDYTEKGRRVQSLWTDLLPSKTGHEIVNFPTQKPLALLRRIIEASSQPGDLVLDCFSGSGTTAVAAETMKDGDGKPAPRRWIAVDCGKFAIHITRKRLIEAAARPFAVENVGFYARQGEWKDIWQGNPSAQRYRDAMVEVYGGSPIEGFTYLHGKKGSHWIHIGPLNKPVADGQVDAIAKEAASTDTKVVDILSADIPISWNKSEVEEKYGVTVSAKIIPQAAIDAVRNRLQRKKLKDPSVEAVSDIHFFSPPDVEVRIERGGDGVTVTLTRLTVDLDDCLSTQDAKKRAEIKARITDWRALIDYWAIDWDYNGEFFKNDWQSFRTKKIKSIAVQAAHGYPGFKGEKRIAVKVTDIFGNDGVKVVHVTL